jgi:hypothetical protein
MECDGNGSGPGHMTVRGPGIAAILSLATALALTSCSQDTTVSQTDAGSASPPHSSGVPVSVTGHSYVFSSPPGWLGSPSDGPWPVDRIPEDGAPGVAFLFDGQGGDWIAIGERAVPAASTLTDWNKKLRAVNTTDYQYLCGKTSVKMDTVVVDRRPATMATFKCPAYGSVDAVVSTVNSGFGLLITCHSANRTIPVERRECRRLLEGFEFTG